MTEPYERETNEKFCRYPVALPTTSYNSGGRTFVKLAHPAEFAVSLPKLASATTAPGIGKSVAALRTYTSSAPPTSAVRLTTTTCGAIQTWSNAVWFELYPVASAETV